MDIPDAVFKHALLLYLTVHDIVKLDCALMNQEYRSQITTKIKGVDQVRLNKDVNMVLIHPIEIHGCRSQYVTIQCSR